MRHISYPSRWLASVVAVGMFASIATGAAFAQAAPAGFKEGQAVEVREGDTWSAATIAKREGRRYQIRYDDGTEEWVTTDRIRAGSGAATGGKPAATGTGAAGEAMKPATGAGAAKPGVKPASTPKAKPKPAFKVGETVEAKWGGLYRKAKVKNRSANGWTLVNYEPGPFLEWVEPWRLRAVGSTVDEIPHAQPNKTLTKAEPPPKERPADAPAPEPTAGGGAGGAGAMKEADRVEAFKDDPAFREADWSEATSIDLTGGGADRWSLSPDPAPAQKLPTRPITLRAAGTAFSNRPSGVAVSRAAPVAVVSHGREKSNGVERVDLATGKSAGAFSIDRPSKVMDVSPDGKSVLVRADEFERGKKDRVEVWSMAAGPAKKVLALFPYNDGNWASRDVDAAMFVDDTHILTVGGRGRLGIWDVRTGKATYAAQVGYGMTPALSAGGKYLAIGTPGFVVILDPRTATVIARMPYHWAADAAYGFSPSGNRLVAWHAGPVAVWDVATGKLLRDFTLSGNIGGPMEVVADRYGLVNGSFLIDFDLGIPLWRYERSIGESVVMPSGRLLFATTDPARGLAVLANVAVPHEGALALAKQLNGDDLLLLKPGASASLEVNLPGVTAEEQQRVTDHLKKELARIGVTVADGQPVKVVASTSPGKSEERQYRPVGAPRWGPTSKVTVTEQKARLAIEAAGKTVWESSTMSSVGNFLQMKEGQTVEQAVAEASRPNVGFLLNARLPTALARPREPAWYGSGPLTSAGAGAGKAVDAAPAGAAAPNVPF